MVVIATPTRSSVEAGFAYDLVQLIKQEPETLFAISKGTLLPNQRTSLVKQAQKAGASHILFIDSDMRFPPDTLSRLLDCQSSIVACECADRVTGQSNVRYDNNQVIAVGFGVILIDLAVFDVLAEPWFATPFDGEQFVGEDIFFCQKAREAGYLILINEKLSKEIKHIGSVERGLL